MIGGLSEAPRCQPTLSQLFKCNVNASIFVDELTVRVGLVLRDSRGVLIKGLSTIYKVTSSPQLAEAFAIREALSWLKSNHYDHIIVELDCVPVVHALNKSIVDNSDFDCLILDCLC
ncbi:hypothetical protein Goshw_008702 [Gossypium schwendimanii]|uniref:RNase H type-1 domain-containing protein n=1 Tax=Gossypium schwendimanii TaxID=34291 RepID=A0A7J9KR90_GOSSC|nr:hypothetical protein [Gossypium schwendimanii]